MIYNIVYATVGGTLFFAIVYLAVAEGRRRGRAEAKIESAEAGIKARDAMDKNMRVKVGKRWKLIQWARDRLSSR